MGSKLGVLTQSYVLIYDDVPKSLNAGGAGSRVHWSKGHREKKRWEGVWAMLLIARRAKRGMIAVRASALIEVKDTRRRDVENFRPAISKPLADALVAGGWLPDDTADFFTLEGVQILNGVADLENPLGANGTRVVGRTTVSLECDYA